MSGRNLALTGIPRGGTTLACRLMGAAHGCIALFEPMDPATLPQERGPAIRAVQAFFEETRDCLGQAGTAPSKQHDGQIPDNPFAAAGADGTRRSVVSRGLLKVDPPAPGFVLAIKHNAAFAALLPELAEHMQVVAVVRNPLAVLASWNTVDLPVREGRIPAGERLDPQLASRLDGESDRLSRQVIVLDWFFRRFRDAGDAVEVVPYERIVATHGQALYSAAELQGGDDRSLQERNASAAYRDVDIAGLARRLWSGEGAWRHWYAERDVEALKERLVDRPA